ncbi:MAG: type IX secretion system outer membrane channel protein PorV [Bacteroidales bacterium]|nr:type IX secretion system outer membrane channel protein PorV [Bacteroidales bacterium]
MSWQEKTTHCCLRVVFLTIAPDSRSAAMGDVGVATKPDASSQFWNAAKYNFSESEGGVGISYSPWLKNLNIDDINLIYVSGYKKIDSRQTVSGAIRYFSLGDIQFRDEAGGEGITYNPHEYAINVGYGLKLSDNFSGSLSFKFIRSDLARDDNFKPGNAYAFDLGGYYQKDIQLQDKNAQMAFGLNLSNMGTKISYSESQEPDFIPTSLRVGGRFDVEMDEYNTLGFALDLNKLLVPTPPLTVDNDTGGVDIYGNGNNKISVVEGMVQSFYDAPGGFKEEMHEITYSVGAEYSYRNQFAVRTGYFYEHATKGNRKYMTFGVGIRLNVLGIDFSYLVPTYDSNSPLANTVRFTLNFYFDQYASTNTRF